MDERKSDAPISAKLICFIERILTPVNSTRGISLFALLLFLIYAFCTIAPGVLYTGLAAMDHYVFIDGIHRIWSGHTPHLDFSTALGALNFYWPALFGIITDSEHKAFLFYQISSLCIFLGMLVYISRTRLNYFCSFILFIYMAALVGAPLPMGFPGSYVSFASYYNRFGWALLVISFLMPLPFNSASDKSRLKEQILVIVILWIALYTKVTYFIAIFGLFAVITIFERNWLKTLIISTFCLTLFVACVELFLPGFHLAYILDLLMAGKATRTFIMDAWYDLKGNWLSLSSACFSMGVVFITHKKFNMPKFRFFLIVVCFNLFISLFIASNNTDYFGLPSLLSLHIYCFLMVLASVPRDYGFEKLRYALLFVMGLLVFFSAVPEAIERQGALERFFRIGFFADKYPYPFPFPEPMREMKIIEGKVGPLERLDSEGKVTLTLEDLRAGAVPPRQEIYQTQYAFMVAKGYNALLTVFAKWGAGSIINLDFSNPFSTLLDVPSARGEYAWYHAGRNFSRTVHLAPERVFKDAKFIMFPKFPTVLKTARLLQEIYGDYIDHHYTLILNNPYWNVYMANDAQHNGK